MRERVSTLLLVLGTGLNAQDIIVIPGRFDRFTTDELGNVYAVHGDELTLFDAAGQERARNSIKTFGAIRTMDAFYSLKPVLFSAEQGQLLMLDNTLSVQGGVIDLSSRGFPQVTLACASVQNAFWLYDQRTPRLVRVDAQLREIASTGPLDQLIGFVPRPEEMVELDNWLYVNCPTEGILVFDLFGTYARTLPVRGADHFEVRKQAVYFVDNGTLQRYDMRSFDTTVLPLPVTLAAEPMRNARLEQDHLYILLEDRITICRMPDR
ncbi:MAG: hypothetical protein H6595_00485 [Flavobacteriales bacterium]|nr:hypothetical protein [Flavobacteriales bacterium]MCB9165935.1 hypothetical protein [Flavobacteriales bacterium]